MARKSKKKHYGSLKAAKDACGRRAYKASKRPKYWVCGRKAR